MGSNHNNWNSGIGHQRRYQPRQYDEQQGHCNRYQNQRFRQYGQHGHQGQHRQDEEFGYKQQQYRNERGYNGYQNRGRTNDIDGQDTPWVPITQTVYVKDQVKHEANTVSASNGKDEEDDKNEEEPYKYIRKFQASN